jgi:hypothetical protein
VIDTAPAARWALDLHQVKADPRTIATLAAAASAHAQAFEGGSTPAFLEHLRGMGPAGQEEAGSLEASARELWADPARVPEEQRWVRILASVVWRDEVAARLETERRLGGPAMVLPLARTVASLAAVSVEGGQLVTATGAAVPIAPLCPAELAVLEGHPGLKRLGSVTADRLVGWLLRTAFALHLENPHRHLYAVRIVGGFRELARLVGGSESNKVRADVAALVDVLSRCTLTWNLPGDRGGGSLLTWREVERPAPGRPAAFLLGLSPVWTPGLVHLLGRGERALVPWVDLPPLEAVGPYLQPRAVRLFRLAMVALREGALELSQRGGVRLDWPALASEVEFPVLHLPKLLEAWARPGSPLVRDGERWTLAEGPETSAALAMLKAAGAMSAAGVAGGRKAAARRKARRAAAEAGDAR